MTHHRPWRALFVLTLAVLASSARAGDIPYAPNSALPGAIRIVGSSYGHPDASVGRLDLIVRDLRNRPMPSAVVIIDLSECPDIAMCADQLDPDAIVGCGAQNVRKFTDATGHVSFVLLGRGTSAPEGGSAHIYANGVDLVDIAPAVFDLDGSGDVGANDLSVWFSDFGSGLPHPRSDYDASGEVGANDMSEWLTVFGAGTSSVTCVAACP